MLVHLAQQIANLFIFSYKYLNQERKEELAQLNKKKILEMKL